MASSNISVVIPTLNEEEPIADVVRGCLATGLPREVIVVDNGSTDRTAERAQAAGARVVSAPRGYGRVRAARAKLRILEIPVNHRCRTGGESKVSGTLRGTFVAGTRIIATLLRVALKL